MAFYDIHYGNGSAFDAPPSGHTTSIDDGNLLQDSQGKQYENAAIAKAALLPSNLPNRNQGANWVQGLANSFDAQSQERSPADIAPDKIIKNPNFNMLYLSDPQKANVVYQRLHPEGKTFDEALKEQQDQKKFIQTTVQKRIADNKLRQGITGQWEESMDVPADPNNPLDKGGQKWVPASYQTQDLIKRAGGPEGVGLGNYSNLPLPEMSKALTGAGITGAAAQTAWLDQNGLVEHKDQVAPAASSNLNRFNLKDLTIGTPMGDKRPFNDLANWWNKPAPKTGQYPMDNTSSFAPQTRSKEELLHMLLNQ